MALVHSAVFDAVNAIERQHRPYRATGNPPPDASADAAAGGAAHAVLVRLFPDQRERLDATLAEFMQATGGSSEARAAGAAFGASVGADAFAARAADGTAAPGAYRPVAMPGRYIATTIPMFSEWQRSKPWLMERPDQFRPGPPPELGSAQWAADFNESKALGAKASATRSKEQTEVGQFWIVTGAPACNPIVRELASRGTRTRAQNARLFALTYLAMADSLVAVFDA
jgi:hypothetical protein